MATGKHYATRIEDITTVDAIENLLANLCNTRNLSYPEAVRELFLAGYIYFNGQPGLTTLDESTKLNLAIQAELERMTLLKLREQHLFKLLDHMGQDEFEKWCQANNVNPEPIIANSEEIRKRILSDETRNISLWLEHYLSDYAPHKVEDVLRDAQIDGKLPDAVLYPEQYKTKLRSLQNIASNCGYSSRDRRGIWQKPLS